LFLRYAIHKHAVRKVHVKPTKTMKKTNFIEVEASTIKEAIEKALKQLSAKKKDVEIKILSEGERGLFDMKGAKPARIRVTLKTKQ